MANGHGGARPNAGNKTKQDFEKTNTILLTAIKQIKNVETDEEARIELAKELYSSQRGQLFIAEHLFGKPKETIEATHNVNDFNIKDIFKIGNKTE
jgi:septation ring formation regulator EzrA